jgi:hypothetical protein
MLWFGDDVKRPGSHALHARSITDEPARLTYSPAGHVRHGVHVERFVVVVKVPTSQLSHTRLVVVSALGTGDSCVLMGWFVRTVLKDGLLKLPSQDHERKEALSRASGLDWVIARPGRLTHGPARGRYVARAKIAPVPGSIARADVADFLVTAADSEAWVGKAVHLGG